MSRGRGRRRGTTDIRLRPALVGLDITCGACGHVLDRAFIHTDLEHGMACCSSPPALDARVHFRAAERRAVGAQRRSSFLIAGRDGRPELEDMKSTSGFGSVDVVRAWSCPVCPATPRILVARLRERLLAEWAPGRHAVTTFPVR